MKWVKHDSDANQDAKLQNVLLDYGLEGYGLYWYCIEMIVAKIDNDNITFELEHDARIIARNTGSTPQKVEEMMRYFVNQGLFESSEGVVTCLKLAKRLDKSMTSNPQMREIIGKLKSHDSIMTQSAKPMQDKIRLDKNRVEEKDILSEEDNSDSVAILNHLNKVCGSKYKSSTKSHIKEINGRLKDGFTLEEIKKVIDHKFMEWGTDQKMAQYLRPATLFSVSKFQGYLISANTVNTVTKVDHTFGHNDYDETI